MSAVWIESQADALETAEKAFRTRQAAAALRGWQLDRTSVEDGPVGYFLTRWGMSRHCRDLASLDKMLRDIGCAPIEGLTTIAGA